MRVRIRLERRDGTARAPRAGTQPARPHCAQEGRHLRFLPSCESPLFPFRTRYARKRRCPAKRLPPTCHCSMEGRGCHPVGARSARRPRPLCSDRQEGTLPHRRGERCGTAQARDSSLHVVSLRMTNKRHSAVRALSSVILRSAATKDPARARDHQCHLHHPSCLPFEGRWQRRQALTERSCKGLHLRGAAGSIAMGASS